MAHKYRAEPVKIGGIRFDSKAEASHYLDLLNLERAGRISKLILQPRFDIEVNGYPCGYYKADFAYYDHDEDQHVTLDVKGMDTPLSKLKRKLVKALHGVDVRVVPARSVKKLSAVHVKLMDEA